MGSHHQFQDIQGLASQQPASADMVFLSFAGAWRRSGVRCLSRDGLEFLARVLYLHGGVTRGKPPFYLRPAQAVAIGAA